MPVRAMIASLLAASWMLMSSAIAQPAMVDEPTAAVKSCIVKNAPDVEKAVESLSEGTAFLLQSICAAEISEQTTAWGVEQARKEGEAMRARMKTMCDAQSNKTPPTDEHAASYVGMLCSPDNDAYGVFSETTATSLYSYATSPKATALAAQTLLQLRVKRTNSKQ